MAKLIWDASGEKQYETGVSNGVLYPIAANGSYPEGFVWNGLTTVTDKPTGAEATTVYADNIAYLNMLSAEKFEATIEAYMYPDEFAPCNGEAEVADGATIGQQPRKTFGFSYQTLVGNDTEDIAYGYKIHCVYGAKASVSEKSYQTINESPEAATMSWDLTTTPVNVTGHKPSATFVIDSTKTTPEKMAAVEALLYGTTENPATLPLPDALIAILTTP